MENQIVFNSYSAKQMDPGTFVYVCMCVGDTGR